MPIFGSKIIIEIQNFPNNDSDKIFGWIYLIDDNLIDLYFLRHNLNAENFAARRRASGDTTHFAEPIRWVSDTLRFTVWNDWTSLFQMKDWQRTYSVAGEDTRLDLHRFLYLGSYEKTRIQLRPCFK